MAGEPFTLRLLGGFAIEAGGRELLSEGGARRKALALIKLLAVEPSHSLSRDRVLAQLWPDLNPTVAATQLRKNRLYLKRALQEAGASFDPVLLKGDQLSLMPTIEVDADAFRRDSAKALQQLTDADSFGAAIGRYRGDLLPDDTDDWVEGTRAELRSTYHRLLTASAHLHLSRGGIDEAANDLQLLVASDPVNEEAHRELMRLFSRSGRKDLALRQFELCREVVRRQLDVDVDSETLALYEQIKSARLPLDAGSVADRGVVGREKEIEDLRETLEEVLRSQGRIVVVEGEPGIGKTSLAEALASYASLRGARVVWGRSYEGDADQGFHPWIEVLTALTRDERRASGGGQKTNDVGLSTLLSGRRAGVGVSDQLRESQRRLFAAVSDFLRGVARATPLVIVLDDLQWADDDSLNLLRAFARDMRLDRVLVVATVRSHEGGETMRSLLHDLLRDSTVRRVVLTGLSRDAVTSLISQSAPSMGANASERLWVRTQGNPLFLTELLHLAEDDESVVAGMLPPHVTEVIRRRLEKLPVDCRRMLSAAAVIGQEFELPVLALATELSQESILDTIDAAIHAGIVGQPVPPGLVLRFSHPLIHSVAYEEMSRDQRMSVHLRIAETLERRVEAGDGTLLSSLAHHYARATGTPDGFAKALLYAELAAQRSFELLAYEESVRQVQVALAILATRDPGDIVRRAHLRLRLGRAQWGAGNVGAAQQSYLSALEDARRSGSAETFALAAIWLSGLVESAWVTNEQSMARLREALQLVGEDDSPLRARLLGQIAEKGLDADVTERRRLSEEAVQIARRIGDQQILCPVLQSWHDVVLGPADLDERLQATMEIQENARAIGDYSLLGGGHVRHMVGLLELGDTAGFDQELMTLTKMSRDYHLRSNGRHAIVAQSTRALMRGDFAESEELARQALVAGQEAGDPDSLSIFAGQLFQLRWLQGRLKELEPLAPQFTREAPSFTPWKAALGLLHAELDHRAAAKAALDELAANDFAVLPLDRFWLVSLSVLSQVCRYLEEAEHAHTLYAMLKPFAGRFGVTSFSQGCVGSLHRPLALFSTAFGDLGGSIRHLEAALTANASIGAVPWVAVTQLDLARALCRRGEQADFDRALDLAVKAAATALEVGMAAVAESAATFLADANHR